MLVKTRPVIQDNLKDLAHLPAIFQSIYASRGIRHPQQLS